MENDLKTISNAILDKQKQMFDANSAEVKKNFDTMQGDIDKVNTALAKMNTEPKAPITFMGALKNGLNSKDLHAQLDANDPNFTFNLPMQYNAISTPGGNFTQDGTVPIAPFTQEGGVAKLMYAPTLISNLIQWGTVAGTEVAWTERVSKTDGSAMRAEDAKMAPGDVDWKNFQSGVKIMSEYMKITNESLKDYSFAAGEINSELMDDLKNLLEIQLMTGDNTGNNLNGIIPQATAWAAGTFAATVHEANKADVLRVGINQIFVAGNGGYFPTAIALHPDDVTSLDLLKIADGRYIEVPFWDGEKQVMARVPVVQSTRVTVGDFLIADFRRAKGFIRDGLTIRVWSQNEDDVLYNRSTVTGNMRLAFRIKNVDKTAFVTGTFATAIAALETP